LQYQMRNAGDAWPAGWTAFSASVPWTVPLFDGYKTIDLRFKDGAGNVSDPLSATVILDTTAPTGWVAVADDAYAVNSTSTTVETWASDMNGPVTMRVRNGGDAWPASWVPAGGVQSWTLPAGNGTKTVSVEFKDAAGNITLIKQSVILDTIAPTGALTIDAGAPATPATAATLGLTAVDANAPIDMRLRDASGAWGEWQPFRDSESWTLPGADGAKAVEVQYRDIAGNLSDPIDGSILLDRVAPVTTDNADGLRHRSYHLVLSPTDATSGVVLTEYRIDGHAWREGTSVTLRLAVHRKPASLTRGAHTIDYRSTDAAGNVESIKSCTVILGL